MYLCFKSLWCALYILVESFLYISGYIKHPSTGPTCDPSGTPPIRSCEFLRSNDLLKPPGELRFEHATMSVAISGT